MTDLDEKNLKASTVARKLAALRSLFRFLCREGALGANPTPRGAAGQSPNQITYLHQSAQRQPHQIPDRKRMKLLQVSHGLYTTFSYRICHSYVSSPSRAHKLLLRCLPLLSTRDCTPLRRTATLLPPQANTKLPLPVPQAHTARPVFGWPFPPQKFFIGIFFKKIINIQ